MVIEMTVDNVLVSHSDQHHAIHLTISCENANQILAAFSPAELVQYLRNECYIAPDMRPELKAILEGKNV